MILFSKSGDSYRYMGEFKKAGSEPTSIVKNRYYVPGFEIVSKDPGLITPYIDACPGGRNARDGWTADDIDAFCGMYTHEALSPGDVRAIAANLNKPTDEIRNILDALGGGPSDAVSGQLLKSIRAGLPEDTVEEEMYIDGRDVPKTVNVRVGQAIFRRNLDRIFGSECCITHAARREVLNGSHVYPWKLSNPQEKTNPNNGLLLNRFHDSLFDKYLMTVRLDGTVEYLDSLKTTLGEKVYERMCEPYDRVDFPKGYTPLRKAYEYHNRRFDRIAEAEGRT